MCSCVRFLDRELQNTALNIGAVRKAGTVNYAKPFLGLNSLMLKVNFHVCIVLSSTSLKNSVLLFVLLQSTQNSLYLRDLEVDY